MHMVAGEACPMRDPRKYQDYIDLFQFLGPNLILHSRILINRKIHFDASPPQKVSKAATHMALCPPNKGKHHEVTKPVIYIQSTSSFSQNFENLIIVHFPLNF